MSLGHNFFTYELLLVKSSRLNGFGFIHTSLVIGGSVGSLVSGDQVIEVMICPSGYLPMVLVLNSFSYEAA